MQGRVRKLGSWSDIAPAARKKFRQHSSTAPRRPQPATRRHAAVRRLFGPRRDRVQGGSNPLNSNYRSPGERHGSRQANSEPGGHHHNAHASGPDEGTEASRCPARTAAASRIARPRRSRATAPVRARARRPRRCRPCPKRHAFFTSAFGPPEQGAPDLNVFLTRKIMRFARRWRAIANEHLSRIGHTQARWEALYWIAVSQGGATQRELAECVGIEEPTLVRMLHRLEQEGLVERRASQSDRRTKTIVLTEAAAPHLQAMSGTIDKLREDVLQNIGRPKRSPALRRRTRSHAGTPGTSIVDRNNVALWSVAGKSRDFCLPLQRQSRAP